jgi:hypothetical protein
MFRTYRLGNVCTVLAAALPTLCPSIYLSLIRTDPLSRHNFPEYLNSLVHVHAERPQNIARDHTHIPIHGLIRNTPPGADSTVNLTKISPPSASFNRQDVKSVRTSWRSHLSARPLGPLGATGVFRSLQSHSASSLTHTAFSPTCAAVALM